MKKFKSLFLVAAVALFGFSSCLDGDVTTGNVYHDGNVRFQLSLPPTTLTVGPAQAGEPVTILRGTVFFTTATGVIHHYFTFYPNNTPDVLFTMSDIAGGLTFENIARGASRVHFVGNTPITETIVLAYTNISTVLNRQLNVVTQGGTAAVHNGQQVVNVYGVAPILPGSPNATANIQIAPTVARVELHNITGDHTIAGFTVEGIFMDRFFPQGYIGGRPIDRTTLITRSRPLTAPVHQVFNWPGGGDIPFTEAMHGPIFDWRPAVNAWRAANVGDDLGLTNHEGNPFPGQYLQGISPGDNVVWGYNMFAHYDVDAHDNVVGSQFPLVIIRMSNVTIRQRVEDAAGNLIGYRIINHPEHYNEEGTVRTHPYLFVTIRGFIPVGQTAALSETNGFLPRRVHQIGLHDDIGWFSRDNVTREPYELPVDVEVTIEPMRWVPIEGRPVV